MASHGKVTVDEDYFEALLRRADCHSSTSLLAHSDPVNVTILKVEYDCLLRINREYGRLKDALFKGGITSETLDLLTSGAGRIDGRKDSAFAENASTEGSPDVFSAYEQRRGSQTDDSTSPRRYMHDQHDTPASSSKFTLDSYALLTPSLQLSPGGLNGARATKPVRRVYGLSCGSDDAGFDEDEVIDESFATADIYDPRIVAPRRTLFLSGFSEGTTYEDLLSVIKGGKILNISIHAERRANVTFLDGAAEFLNWARRDDIYLHSKRIDVKWAKYQFRLNQHITHKVADGATRNLLVRGALDKGLTEAQIREDMEHIHNLVVVSVAFRGKDAYVSTNSVHNALFARTCMMSRAAYKGCRIEYYPDECDTPLPQPRSAAKTRFPEPVKKTAPLGNRFGLLEIHGDSDEENLGPSSTDSDGETIGCTSTAGRRMDSTIPRYT